MKKKAKKQVREKPLKVHGTFMDVLGAVAKDAENKRKKTKKKK